MLEYAIKKAREVADHYEIYALGGKGCARKCEKTFLWTCSDFQGKDVQVWYLPANVGDPAMPGTVIKRTDGYDILLRRGLLPVFERFVVCKELFEIILDHPGGHQMDISKHLEATLFSPAPDGGHPLHVLSELVTPVAAAEFLFPYSHRAKIVEAGRREDVKAIAEQYDIPPAIVDWTLSDFAMSKYNPDQQG